MINKSNSIIHKKLFRNQNTKFSLDKRTSRSTTHLTIKDTQRNLLNSLSKDNDEYIIREYSKIIPKDFNMYVETIESSLGNYKMDYEKKNEEKQLKNYNPNFYIHLKDKLLIKKIHKHNRNFFNHALTPKNDDSNLKITIREKQYPNPYKSLAVIKHNSFIFDEINKNFLNRQGDLFKQKILNIKKYNNKYKVKMPKIH